MAGEDLQAPKESAFERLAHWRHLAIQGAEMNGHQIRAWMGVCDEVRSALDGITHAISARVVPVGSSAAVRLVDFHDEQRERLIEANTAIAARLRRLNERIVPACAALSAQYRDLTARHAEVRRRRRAGEITVDEADALFNEIDAEAARVNAESQPYMELRAALRGEPLRRPEPAQAQ